MTAGGAPAAAPRGRSGLALGVVTALLVLHYDFWFWSDRSLVLGFLPVGLFYQALVSVLAAAAWAAVVRYGWPARLEQWASDGEGAVGGGGAGEPRA